MVQSWFKPWSTLLHPQVQREMQKSGDRGRCQEAERGAEGGVTAPLCTMLCATCLHTIHLISSSQVSGVAAEMCRLQVEAWSFQRISYLSEFTQPGGVLGPFPPLPVNNVPSVAVPTHISYVSFSTCGQLPLYPQGHEFSKEILSKPFLPSPQGTSLYPF